MAEKSFSLSGILFCCLLVQMASAAPQNFHMQYTPSSGYASYVDSDLDAVPAISISTPTNSICTGTPVTVTLAASGGWNNNGIVGGVANSIDYSEQLPSPPSYSTPIPYPVYWLNSGQQSYLHSLTSVKDWYTGGPTPGPDNWAIYLAAASPAITPYSAEEKSYGIKYSHWLGGSNYEWWNAGSNYSAYLTLFCNANAVLNINGTGGGTYPVSNWAGSYSTSPLYLGAGNHSINASFNIQQCLMAIRNTANPSAPQGDISLRTARIAINNTFMPTYNSLPFSVTVENPFNCNCLSLSGIAVTPANPTPSSPITFSFNITNNCNRNVSITGIGLAPLSSYTNLVLGAYPSTVQIGQTITVPGTVTTPNYNGLQPLRFQIFTATTTPDCTGSPATCYLLTNTLQVPVSSQYCTLTLINHTTNFGNNDWAYVNATCTYANGTAFTCPPLTWNDTVVPPTAGNEVPSLTPSAPHPQTNFSVATALTQSATITANNTAAGLFCSLPITVTNPYDDLQITCGFVNNSAGEVYPGGWSYVQANCTNNSVPIPCPQLNWSTTVPSSTVVPPQTSTGIVNPMTNFSVSPAAIPPLSGDVNIICADGAQCIATCSFQANVTNPYDGLQITCGFVNSTGDFFPGDWAYAQANCTNNSVPIPCPQLNWSTNVTSSAVVPPQTPAGVSDPMTNFSVSASASPPLAGAVNIVCANGTQCNATCPIQANVWPEPDGCSLLLDHPLGGQLFTPNDTGMVNATCYYGFLPTACPNMTWAHDILGGSLNPAYTPQQFGPQSSFTTFNAPVPQTGMINATSANPGIPLNCSVGIAIVENFGVDYNLSVTPNGYPTLNQVINFPLVVANIGNDNATNQTSIVADFSAGCTGGCTGAGCSAATGQSLSYFPVNPLNTSESFPFGGFHCACNTQGMQTVTIEVNPQPPAQSEYNFFNNIWVWNFLCATNIVQMTCSFYV